MPTVPRKEYGGDLPEFPPFTEMRPILLIVIEAKYAKEANRWKDEDGEDFVELLKLRMVCLQDPWKGKHVFDKVNFVLHPKSRLYQLVQQCYPRDLTDQELLKDDYNTDDLVGRVVAALGKNSEDKKTAGRYYLNPTTYTRPTDQELKDLGLANPPYDQAKTGQARAQADKYRDTAKAEGGENGSAPKAEVAPRAEAAPEAPKAEAPKEAEAAPAAAAATKRKVDF